jgi:hypothetical protein
VTNSFAAGNLLIVESSPSSRRPDKPHSLLLSNQSCAAKRRTPFNTYCNFRDQTAFSAAGDANRGQSIVVWAIGEGRDVARGIDIYLNRQNMNNAANGREWDSCPGLRCQIF